MSTLPLNDRLSGPFTALAGQVAFDADFPLVDIPGAAAGACVFMRRTRAGATLDLALGVFTVTAIAANAFTLSLVTPALVGDVYWIVGRAAQARMREHPAGGAVRTPTLNDDARELAARAQEAQRDLDRAVTAPIGEPGMQLLPQALREGFVPVFENGGLGRFDTPEVVVATNALGQAVAMPLTTLFATIGTTLLDDGEWLAVDDPASKDDGVFG